MGMAASQARLLTITARLHDVEYQAQSIQNAKIALATQQDDVQREYLAALDETTLTFKDNNGQLVTATFNNLCSPYAAQVAGNKNYIFRDRHNRIIVDDETYNLYKEYTSDSNNDKNAYEFALWAITGSTTSYGDESKDFESIRSGIEAGITDGPLLKLRKDTDNLWQEILGIYNTDGEYDSAAKLQLDDVINDVKDDSKFKKADREALQKLLDKIQNNEEQYIHQFYTTYAGDIFHELTGQNGDNLDLNKYDFYVRMFKLSEQEGGIGACVPISEFNGIDGIGVAANDSEFLQRMIKSGEFTVDELSLNYKNGQVSAKTTSVSSDSVLAHTTTTSFDKTRLAKAEAEYEYKMKQIDRKDKAFDMDLSKLETQRNALKTEYDSVKKVISDNIERTFGIFS